MSLHSHDPTAIVGLACRFPGGADDPQAFWNNLAEGRDSIVEVPEARWSSAHYAPDFGTPGRTRSRWCGLIEGVDRFDARFFQISAREARSMDPQQRLLLEETWRCIESAAIPMDRLVGDGRTGVFVGVMANDYQQRLIEAQVEPDAFSALGNYECILANRISHCFGFSGPSLSINAACASSLVALHLARRALAAGDCEYALVGAANLNLHPWKYISFTQAGMLSPDGHCRTFDAGANGYVPGDGIGVVLLTTLARANAERRRIHAVVRGSAINHVGGGRSITAPSVDSQRRLIESAAEDAQIGLDTVGYVEAHGTGTSLGDPIEVAALEQVYRASGAVNGACALGSVKSNIGHLEAAAGMAGLIKLIMMLRHGTIPPTLHVDAPNPLLDIDDSCFRIASAAEPWPAAGGLRRAGLSSFGFGGANAHAIIEEAPRRQPEVAGPAGDDREVFLLSANTGEALRRNLLAWRQWFDAQDPDALRLRDVCGVAAQRVSLPHRFAVCATSLADVMHALDDALAKSDASDRAQTGSGQAGSVKPWGLLFGDEAPAEANTLSDRLAAFGFEPAMIGAEGAGWDVALAIAGCRIERAPDRVRISRPRLPLQDPVSGNLLAPLRASGAYLDRLRAAAQGWCASCADTVLERGRALWCRQQTFTKYLREWEEALGGTGTDIEQMLRDEPRSLPGVFAVALSLRELDGRWSMGRIRKTDDAFEELATLIVDGLLSRSDAVSLLTGGDSSTIAMALDGRLARARSDRPYSVLRDMHRDLVEVGDPDIWLERAKRLRRAGPPAGYCQLCIGTEVKFEGEHALPDLDENTLRDAMAQLWQSGADVAIDRLYPAGTFDIIDVPTYRFAGPSAWVDSADARGAASRSRDVVAFPVSQAAAVDDAAARSPPSMREYANEHCIGDRQLVPGACLIAAALESAGERLERAMLLKPLELASGSDREPEIAIVDTGTGLHLRHGPQTVFRATRATDGAGSGPAKIPGPAIGPSSPVAPDARVYAAFARRGYAYGPALQVLGAGRPDGGSRVYALTPAAQASNAGVIEAAFQALLDTAASRSEGLLVPFMVESLYCTKEAHRAAAFAVVDIEGITVGEWGVRGRVSICDAQGRALAEFDGVDLRRLGDDAPAQPPPVAVDVASPIDAAQLLYVPVWREQADAACESASGEDRSIPSLDPQAWVVGEIGPLTAALSQAMPGAKRIGWDQLPKWQDAERLLRDGTFPDRIVVAFASPAAESVPLAAFVALCRGIARANPERELHLQVVTTGWQRILAGDAAGSPHLAAVVGVAKSVAREVAPIVFSAIDIDPDFDDVQIRAALCERGSAPLSEIAYRGRRRHVRVLERLNVDRDRSAFKPGGIYVIVGGLGGIGRAVARWIAVEYGAKVALIGRRGHDADADAFVRELWTSGGDAIYLSADTCDRQSLGAALEAVRDRFGRIDGAMHAALSLSDRSIRHMDDANFQRTYTVKAEGASLLAELTARDELDFLVFFSSILSLQGNPGQANYIAGCAYQDALAIWLEAHRKCPALCVNWGYWGETGAVADRHHARLLHEQGIDSIGIAEGIAGLESALVSGKQQVVVARLSEERMAQMGIPASPKGQETMMDSTVRQDDTERPDCESGLTLIDAYALARVADFLRCAAPVSLRSGHGFSFAQLADELSLQPGYRRLLAAWLSDMTRHGLLQRTSDDLWMAAICESAALEDLRASVLDHAPDKRAYLELLDTTMDAAADMLSGRRAAPTVIFPDSSSRLVEGIYRDNAFSDAHNRMLAERIVDDLAASPERRVRILEIGAGTGGSTALILPMIDRFSDRIEYVYSDISLAFTKLGKRQFSDGRPYLAFALLDIESIDDRTLGRLGTFDLILATNVVHACRDLRKALAGIGQLLATGGRLLLNELCRVEPFWTSTFGFLDGWWLFEDEELRLANGPLLGPQQWCSLLANSGFERPDIQGLPGRETGQLRQCVVSAFKPASNPRTNDGKARTMNAEQLRDRLSAITAEVLEVDAAELDSNETFSDLGIDSILGVELVAKISASLGIRLEATVVYDYPSIETLAARLSKDVSTPPASVDEGRVAQVSRYAASTPEIRQAPVADAMSVDRPRETPRVDEDRFDRANDAVRAENARSPAPSTPTPTHDDGIAVIGMSGRFPGADNLDAFWSNLIDGVDSVTEVPAARWDIDSVYSSDPRRPNATYCRFGGFLGAVDRFDAGFFRITPREAERMDPQQRLLLEESWRALEDGGYAGARRDGVRLGVFVGARHGDYLNELHRLGQDLDGASFTGNDIAMLAGRIAYQLDADGPALSIDTACSSSLVAIHQACQALRRGEAQMALAAGVFVMNTAQFHVLTSKTGMLAPNGRCRTFDRAAEGFVPAEGVGVLLLKPLAAARADGDHIYGVVKASGVNQDGRTNGITAPSARSQTRLIEEVYANAKIAPGTISYVEAHGTGTMLGDPIEIEGLSNAYAGSGRLPPESCWIGSVKSNIGHAVTAAGVAGTIKVLLAMRAGRLPPSLHFDAANPHIDFAATPFKVPTRAEPWRSGATPLRAAVSSFGFSGTNCHLVIEQASAASTERRRSRPELFVLSATTEQALRRRVFDLQAWLRRHQAEGSLDRVDAGDVAYSLAIRQHERCRVAFVAADLHGLIPMLDGPGIRCEHPGGNVGGALMRRFVSMLTTDLAACATDDARGEVLEAIAESYAGGHAVAWFDIYPARGNRVVPLPTYPFEAERHWPEATLATADSRPAAPVAEVAETRLLVRQWQPAGTARTHRLPENTVVLVGRLETGLGERLKRALPNARIAVADAGHGRDLAERLLHAGPVDAVIDLVDLTGGAPLDARIALLQGFAETSRHNGLTLLHVTDRLLTPSGAEDSAAAFAVDASVIAEISALLRAEYRRIRSRHIDIDARDAGQGLPELLLQELGDLHGDAEPDVSRLALRGGRRLRAVLAPVGASTRKALRIEADGVYIVSGGVRGLGLEVARMLVARGARKLVLLGRQPVPPMPQWPALLADAATPAPIRARIAPLQALVDAGVDIDVIVAALDGRDAIASVLDRFDRDTAPIRGFVHCAGAVDLEHPVFTNRSAAQISAVIAPKTAGLALADALLERGTLDFVVVFSSVSALAPRLAAGMLDYAAANAVLNTWAERRRAEGRPCWALAWGNWIGAGMGAVAGRSYAELGLSTHDVATGLSLFERALEHDAPVVLPLAIRPGVFDAMTVQTLPREPATTRREAEASDAAEIANPSSRATHPQVVSALRAALGEALKLPDVRIQNDAEFGEMGIDSVLIVEFVAKLERWLEQKIDPSLTLRYPTILSLADALQERHPEALMRALSLPAQSREALSMPQSAPGAPSGSSERTVAAAPVPMRTPDPAAMRSVGQAAGVGAYPPLAIIGMACHFPNSPDVERYWSNLRDGVDCTREIPAERWSIEEHYAASERVGKSVGKRGGFIDGIEYFDPRYFELPAEDAAEVDPLVRQFLEVGAECIHDAGYRRDELAGRSIGVFVGARVSNYADRIVAPGRRTLLGIGQNFIAAHLSHFYDLHGPAMVIDTACSSSLASLHQAAMSLINGECEMALAGGSEILLDEVVYQRLSEARVLSPDGRCAVFDERANGFVPGEGAGAVLLTTLERAIANGDRIHAVIEATAMNNDGRTMGVTTPNPAAQQRVVREALRRAGVDARAIGYVEAHGTGTALGDPVELRALTELYAADGVAPGRCPVGSVKSNLGHLLSSAGIASVLKVVLALRHRALPPTIHCERPNPRFDFSASPFRPCTALEPWDGPLRAGISSFGFGGTNLHAIIAAPPSQAIATRRPIAPPAFDRRRFWLDRSAGHGHRWLSQAVVESGPRVRKGDQRALGRIRFLTENA